MVLRLNPNSPAIAGLEWYPTRRLPRALLVGSGIGAQFNSTASESIARIWARLQGSVPNTTIGLDIYDLNAPIWLPGDVQGGVSVPAVDVSSTAGWQQSSDNGASFVTYQNAGTNGFSFVNKVVPDNYAPIDILALVNLSGKMLRYLPTGSQTEGHLTWSMANAFSKITDGSVGNNPGANRVGWIEVTVAAKAANAASPTIDGWLRINGTNYGSDDGPTRISPHWARYTFRFFWDPAIGAQWYNADIANFLSGGTVQFGLSVKGGAGTDYRIGAVNVVFRYLPERRLTTGYANATTVEGYIGFLLQNVATGATANWAKTTGHYYNVEFFLTGKGGSAVLIGMDQATLAEDPLGGLLTWGGCDQPTVPGTAIPNGDAALSLWAPTFYMEKAAAGGIGADFQAYARSAIMRVAVTDGLDIQGLTTHATASYGQVMVVLGAFDAAGNTSIPDQPLTLGIHATVGDALVGGTVNIQPSEVAADGRWHLLNRHLSSSAALLAGTAYYLKFSTTGVIPWSVALAYNDLAVPDANASISGNAAINGVGDTSVDILANIGTVPTVPAAFVRATGTFTPSPLPPCGPTTIKYVALDWTSTALGGQFGYYEVQRSDDGATWFPIANITAEAKSAFNDFEAKRGVAQFYRIRVIRNDGASSDWSATLSLTVTTDGTADLILVSNADPALAIAYQEDGNAAPLHTFARANAGLPVVHAIAGRQTPIAFRSLIEGNADVFTRTLLVEFDTAGAPVLASQADRWPFDPLIACIEDTTVPYICLLDGHGRRWYTFPEFVAGSYARGLHMHQATVKFTEVAAVPAVLVTATPWP